MSYSSSEYACLAIRARINGIWDDVYLVPVGPMSGDLVRDIQAILAFYGQ
jgi:hypothetical protein